MKNKYIIIRGKKFKKKPIAIFLGGCFLIATLSAFDENKKPQAIKKPEFVAISKPAPRPRFIKPKPQKIALARRVTRAPASILPYTPTPPAPSRVIQLFKPAAAPTPPESTPDDHKRWLTNPYRLDVESLVAQDLPPAIKERISESPYILGIRNARASGIIESEHLPFNSRVKTNCDLEQMVNTPIVVRMDVRGNFMGAMPLFGAEDVPQHQLSKCSFTLDTGFLAGGSGTTIFVPKSYTP